MNKEELKDNNINPNHYKNKTSLECIEAMQIAFGNDMVIDFCLCNAWKYIWRWKNKNGVEDLKKAEWYIEKGRELLDNNLEYYCNSYFQRFDSMSDYINSQIKCIQQKQEFQPKQELTYADQETMMPAT